MIGRWIGGALLAAGLAAGAAEAETFPNPLPVENAGTVTRLSTPYPDNWVFLDYLASPGLIDSKAELVNPDARYAKQVIGQFSASYYANILVSTARPEVYVAETFYSRGTRGTRTDVITLYDKETLSPHDEIVLPGAKRWIGVVQPNAFQFADHETLGLVYNFTPRSTVTVVNLVTRQVLNEVPLPGCAMIYPTGPRGFSSMCADGTMVSVQLDKAGAVEAQNVTTAFNDLTDDPLFAAPGVIGGVSYFVTYKGKVQPVDLSGVAPRLLPTWSLVTDDEAKANWRPSGNQQIAGQIVGGSGRLYVLMQPNGKDGSHLEGGNQVWVFDVASHAKLATIILKGQAQCIAVSGGEHPRLMATTLGASLQVYDAITGASIASMPIASTGAETLIYPARP